ncbi:MAG: helix-turn-helix domain-containing protein [Oscillospiraceae bacterium]|nr:helix-turn-helix domain-containing protein [Oscillospiraceae bacterium]MBR3597911.1 helix-turn-helix domain-containing protein [Clostridia bacterium]MBQ5322698.1 helix-turn-helix domain-containing protein [Oscillospiraceae bacterium]MBQ8595897.1 helix-turn-helix domain-containing protein [Oscillospiraceae bacterium]MBR2042316.1 helix-turn-helix domain-containing protein [Oscillospiraceae bacterium]
MNAKRFEQLYKMMFPEYPDVVNVKQLQQMLGISRHLAYDLIEGGDIQAILVGNAFRIPKVSVINYVLKYGGDRDAG